MTTENESTESDPTDGAPTATDETPTPAADAGADETTDGKNAETKDDGSDDVEVNSLDYQQVTADKPDGIPKADLNRFQDIKVTVSADLGRAKVPLQTLLSLGEGSVLELDRQIDSPVELVAQGVPLASGEVVVVNGCFAIRVTNVYESKAG